LIHVELIHVSHISVQHTIINILYWLFVAQAPQHKKQLNLACPVHQFLLTFAYPIMHRNRYVHTWNMDRLVSGEGAMVFQSSHRVSDPAV